MTASLVLGIAMVTATNPYRGADCSFIPQYRADGTKFYDHQGKEGEVLEILQKSGMNLLRLRLWNNHKQGHCNLENTIQLTKEAHKLGMKVLLDFHYSDDWADPSKQFTPAAWKGQDLPTLTQSLENFTYDTLSTMKKAGAAPDMVQIGNEVRGGMCWPVGRISPENGGFKNFATLLKAGVRASRKFNPKMPVMIHYDNGAQEGGTRWFYDGIRAEGVDYDWIGLSYYPWWHGTMDELESNLTALVRRFDKPIMIVETSYPFSLGKGDEGGNFVGEEKQLSPGFPATESGQAAFTRKLHRVVQGLPAGKGLGVVWWAPEYIASKSIRTPCENLALFDFKGKVLLGADALGGN